MTKLTVIRAVGTVSTVASLLVAGSAFAAVDQTNQTTGPHSVNKNRVVVLSGSSSTVRNTARATNNVKIKGTTGHNTQKHNTVAGDIDTGSVVTDVMLENNLNQNGCGCPTPQSTGDVSGSQTNDTTGPNSTNKNTLIVDNSNSSKVTNTATANNHVNVSGDTGHNSQTGNTVAGSISTGDVDTTVSVSNTLN